jgi:MFS family permease
LDLTPLRRHPEYRWLYSAQFVSFLGTMVTHVALPYQVFQQTRSPLAVGLLGLAELLPLLVTAFWGGALADTTDRRRLILASHVGLAAGTAFLTVNAWRGQPPVWTLFAATAVLSGLSGLQRPSLESLTQRLVGRDDMPAAAALSSFRGSVGMIAGPALAGVLIAYTGLASTYLFDFATYAFSFLAIRRLTPIPPEGSRDRPTLHAILDGFRYAARRQELIGTYVVDFIAMIFGMPMALFPALADRLGGTAALGPLYAAPAVGALVASVTARWSSRVHRHGLAVAMAATGWGIAIVAFGFSSQLLPALFFLAVAGWADGVSGIFRSTMWNQTIPSALRGRLVGIEMVSYMSGPLLGNVEAGMVAAAFGIQASVVSGGVLCVVGVALAGLFLPRFVRYDARDLVAPAS